MTDVVIQQSTKVNSTTYVDMLGVDVGITRLPGEISADFLRRVSIEGNIPRNHTYSATLERIANALGLETSIGIVISCEDPIIINCSIGGLTITNLEGTITYVNSKLLNIAADNVWEWRYLSDLVNDINSTSNISAVLQVQDRPALCLSKQTNYLWAQESVAGRSYQLQQKNPQISTVSFNNTVPTYTVINNTLLFTAEVPANTYVTYVYIPTPFDVVISDVGMFGLTEPGFATVAASGSVLTQQAGEILQDIMTKDRSYWAK